ncbi:MAG: penicillin-insensitive murein endopeptidase [Deltaproteobacteria bacterium]|nr:penicillin-insensitive murein endopeptidase [Nannocystaceae bacterium]
MVGAWLAGAVFLAAVAGGVAYVVTTVRSEGTEPDEAGAETVVDANESAPAPVANGPAVVVTAQPPAPPDDPDHPRSLDKIAWTVATPATLDELAQTWSLSRETLAALNPELPNAERLAAGTRVVVYTGSIATSESVGPPNDGRLIGGVPFPEGRAWALPGDRSHAFGTGETIVGVLAALDAYAAKYPEAAPIQLGELSARRGGPIYGHQSHQAGRDIDIRLVIEASGERFDAERNWFLVKTLIEGGEVVSIFLNRSQQVWLRAAAEADVGAAGADRYFAIIKHESGHTIHIHVRFRCPDSDRRCVAYSLEESDAEVAKKLSKLPTGGGGGTLVRKKGKLPTLRPKTKPALPSKKPPRPPAKGR